MAAITTCSVPARLAVHIVGSIAEGIRSLLDRTIIRHGIGS
jgi:hypothetical protein